MASFAFDPDATLDFSLDLSEWLGAGETIANATVTATSTVGVPPTVQSVTYTGTAITVWITGGTDRSEVKLTFHFTTNAGRIDDRSMTLRVRER